MRKKLLFVILLTIFTVSYGVEFNLNDNNVASELGGESQNTELVLSEEKNKSEVKNEVEKESVDNEIKEIEEESLEKDEGEEKDKNDQEEKNIEIEKEEEEEGIEDKIEETLYDEMLKKAVSEGERYNLFGTSIFNVDSDNFELPSEFEAGKNYVLGAGDTVQIRVWGDVLPKDERSPDFMDIPINNSGTIYIKDIGVFNVNGKTISELEAEMKLVGEKKYKGINIDLALAKMRSVRVFVIGQVAKPGTYLLNPLSNVLNSLYVSGGINNNSSLRNLKILRKDKTINLDLYDYLIKGNRMSKIVLQEGDTVFIPPLNKKVTISGEVVNPGMYEIKGEKRLEEIIKLAGGLTNQAYRKSLKIKRIGNDTMTVYDISDIKTTEIQSGDKIEVGEINQNFINGIRIYGNVTRPGVYEVGDGASFSVVLKKAGGFLLETYLERADIFRANRKGKLEKISFSLTNEDPELKASDMLFIYSMDDVGAKEYARISGGVNKNGIYRIYPNTRVSDMIFMAKGLKEKDVYLKRADVYRTRKNGKIEVIKIDLEKVIDGDLAEDVEIQKYDVIKIYTVEEMNIPEYVEIIGEVNNPGTYPIYENNRKISDIILAAKGLNRKNVYLPRADIYRLKKDGTLKVIKVILEKVVKGDETEDVELEKYDLVRIYAIDEIENKSYVQVLGSVNNPGVYRLDENDNKVSNLIFRANGLDGEQTYLQRADIYRLKDNGNIEILRVDLNKVLKGRSEEDIELKNYDVLKVFTYNDVRISPEIYVYGEVRSPGEYRYYDGMTINDVVFYSKGLKIGSDKTKIEIVRSSLQGKGMENIFVDFNLEPNFSIQEYDQIFIRKIPNWEERKIVVIDGFVNYPGEYAISKNDTLNDIIERSGGFKEEAFPKGVEMYRKIKIEKEVIQIGKDEKINIGIETQNAKVRVSNLQYDKKRKKYLGNTVLKAGDMIYIPEIPNSVQVMGAVYLPGIVIYDKSKNLKEYINSVGGVKEQALKKDIFVVKYDGQTKKRKFFFFYPKVSAGDTIIVPLDPKEKKGWYETTLKFAKDIVELATAYAVVDSVVND